MAASSIDICNMALSNANIEGVVMDLDDPTEEAARCKQWYHIARRGALTLYDWTFARKFVALAPHSDPVEETAGFYFSQRYEIPLDLLVIRELRPFGPDDRQLPHKQEISPVRGTRSLLTNVAEGASIRYTFDQNDSFLFSPLFDIGLGLFLGSYLVESLTGKMSKRRELLLESQGMLMQAAESDKNSDQDEPERDASWIQDRSAFGFGLANRGGANNVFVEVQNLRAATGSSLAVR